MSQGKLTSLADVFRHVLTNNPLVDATASCYDANGIRVWVGGSGDQHRPLFELVQLVVGSAGEYTFEIGPDQLTSVVVQSDGDPTVGWSFSFPDGSRLDDVWYLLPSRDADVRVLEPIEARELAGIEPLIAQLWAAVDSDELSETQRAQIVAMAELIKAEQREAVPGETQRWKLVGPVRAALRYLAKDVVVMTAYQDIVSGGTSGAPVTLGGTAFGLIKGNAILSEPIGGHPAGVPVNLFTEHGLLWVLDNAVICTTVNNLCLGNAS